MPRHRIEHEPRHRAPRADRRGAYSAASARPPSHAKSSSRAPSHAKPSARARSHAKPSTEPGQLGEAFRAIGAEAPERVSATGTRLRREQPAVLTGAVRGLMVSPWFAAGAGFVIAAGAFMYAPHASLSIGPGTTRTTPCFVSGCPVPQQEPTMAGGGASPLVTATASPSSSSRSGRHAGDDADHAVDVTYTVQPESSGTFQMTLTVTSDQEIGPWQLSMVIPGVTGVEVYDGTQQGSGTDGATGGGPAGGGYSPGGTNGDDPSPGPSAGDVAEKGYDPADVLRVIVDGVGSARIAPEDGLFHDAQGSVRFS
jgi:hypothetical protein